MEFEEVINGAAVQYGDLKGTVGVDGHGGGEIHDVARECGVPGGYFPVGFSIFGTSFSLTIYAVKCDEVGDTGTEVAEYAKRCGEDNPIPVYAFRADASWPQVMAHVKRLRIVGKSRGVVGDVPLGVKEFIDLSSHDVPGS